MLSDPWTLGRDDILKPSRARTVVEDTATALTYTGAWTRGTDSGYRSATKTVSNAVGSTAQWQFTGNELRIYCRSLAAGGRFEVRVDEAVLDVADTVDPAGRYQAMVFERTGLTAGPHDAQIRVVAANPASGGGWVGLDFVSSA